LDKGRILGKIQLILRPAGAYAHFMRLVVVNRFPTRVLEHQINFKHLFWFSMKR